MRRCRDLIEILSPAAARFPLTVLALFDQALKLHARWQRHQIGEHGLHSAAGRIEARTARLLERNYRNDSNRRLARHLRHEQPWLFAFLYCPGVEATNNRAERAIRPAVMARRLCGGSRTGNGARTQQILTSVLRTCTQQGKDSFKLLVDLLRSPRDQTLDIIREFSASLRKSARTDGYGRRRCRARENRSSSSAPVTGLSCQGSSSISSSGSMSGCGSGGARNFLRSR